MGQPKEVPVIDGCEVIMLIDSGAQVSSVSSGFCNQMTLEKHSLGRLLELEVNDRVVIPDLGYVEVNLQIPGIWGYNVLMLVILTMTYAKRILVMVSSKIINMAMAMSRKGELARATDLEAGPFWCSHV